MPNPNEISLSDHLHNCALLESVDIPGVGTVRAEGLTVIVGPNSSGKSHLLKDIEGRIRGEMRQLVVLKKVRLNKPNSFDSFVDSLRELGLIEEINHPSGNPTIRAVEPSLGKASQAFGDLFVGQVESNYRTFVPFDGPLPNWKEPIPFLQMFGPLLTTSLFLNNRLNFQFDQGHFDYQNSRPSNELQLVFFNRRLGDALSAEMRRAFGKAVWVDGTRGSVICIRVGEDSQAPDATERLDPQSMRAYRTVGEEGDGLRSFCAICLGLIPSRRPLCLIDEPELCLHPPQEHRIGQLIGRQATRANRATFVATHSSHVLRGILETAEHVRVIRMTRRSEGFEGRLVEDDALKRSLRVAKATSPAVLDAIFADAGILVEGESDRVVYEAAFPLAESQHPTDAQFVPVGGTGAIAQVADVLRALNVPVSVVADLDFMMDPDRVGQAATALGADRATVTKLKAACRRAKSAVESTVPITTVEEVKSELGSLSNSLKDWTKDDDRRAATALRRLLSLVDRGHRLKSGGTGAYPEGSEVRRALNEVCQACAEIGIFLVERGELEGWARELASSQIESKAGIPEKLVHAVREQDPLVKPVIDFMGSVKRHLVRLPERGTLA